MKKYMIVAENQRGMKFLIAKNRRIVRYIEDAKTEETYQTREEAEEEARKLDKANKELVEITEEPHRRIKYQKIMEYEIL